MQSRTNVLPLAQAILPEDKVLRIAMQIGLAVVGSLLLALSAKVKVPMWPVDMSLQSLAVLLIGASFGFRLGLATILLYLAEGAAGLPVFQGTPEKGIGLLYMAGPTAGYLVGFVIMAAIAGWSADRGHAREPLKLFGWMMVGEVVMLALGALWLAVLFGAEQAFAFGIGPFIVTDIVKVALAAALIAGVSGIAGRLRGNA